MKRKEVTIAIENAVEDKPISSYAFFGAFEDGTFVETTGHGTVTEEQMRRIIQKMRHWASALGQQLDAAQKEKPQVELMKLSPEVFSIASEIQRLFEKKT
jgi:hypothetical protein